MNTILSVIIAIIFFGLLVTVHELGHFLVAKFFKVQVNEFAVGMGPSIISKKIGNTKYSLRAVPFGGFCEMGEDDIDGPSENSFNQKSKPKQILILLAGPVMNFLCGFVILLILYSTSSAIQVPVVYSIYDGSCFQTSSELEVGDRILKINNEAVYVKTDVNLLFSLYDGTEVDFLVERDGEKVLLENIPLETRTFEINGQKSTLYGVVFDVQEKTPALALKTAWANTVDFVRIVRLSVMQLFSGKAGIRDMSGPIGVVKTISEVGTASNEFITALYSILYFIALIAVNLAVVNLVPLPAIDGGRIFLTIINAIAMLLLHRQIPKKAESYVHFIGFAALMCFMVLVSISDVLKIFGV